VSSLFPTVEEPVVEELVIEEPIVEEPEPAPADTGDTSASADVSSDNAI